MDRKIKHAAICIKTIVGRENIAKSLTQKVGY